MDNIIHESKFIKGETLLMLDAFPDDCIDLGITSPPYNKQEKHKGWLVDKVVYDNFTDAMPELQYQSNQINVLEEIYRIIKPGGSFFYNHKIRWHRGEMFHPMDWIRETSWAVKQEIVWDRVIAANIRGWRFWQTDERIYWLYKPIDNNLIGKELASKDAKMTSIWRGVPENGKNNPHPAPFPLWIPTRIITSLLDTPGIVLDPYVGSGTTAVAAHLLGHIYIGIDRSKLYLDMARDRIANAEAERDKLDVELGLHQVKSTFTERKELKLKVDNQTEMEI